MRCQPLGDGQPNASKTTRDKINPVPLERSPGCSAGLEGDPLVATCKSAAVSPRHELLGIRRASLCEKQVSVAHGIARVYVDHANEQIWHFSRQHKGRRDCKTLGGVGNTLVEYACSPGRRYYDARPSRRFCLVQRLGKGAQCKRPSPARDFNTLDIPEIEGTRYGG